MQKIEIKDIEYVFAYKTLVTTELIVIMRNGKAISVEATPQTLESLNIFTIRAIENLC